MLSKILTYERFSTEKDIEKVNRGEIAERDDKFYSFLLFVVSFKMFTIISIFFMILINLIYTYTPTTGALHYFTMLCLFIIWVSLPVFARRIISYMQVYQSLAYLDRRGYSSRYRAKYYLHIASMFFLYGLPILLLITIGYEKISQVETGSSMGESAIVASYFFFFFFWCILTSMTYMGVIFARVKGQKSVIDQNKLSGNNYMQTNFSYDRIRVEGKYAKNNYTFSFRRDEIRSFVIISLTKEPLFALPKQYRSPNKTSGEVWIAYVEDKQGYVYNLSLYMQGDRQQENIIPTLKEKYLEIPVRHIQAQNTQELIGVAAKQIDSSSNPNAFSFIIERGVPLCSSLFFPKFIRKGRKREQINKDIGVIEDVNKREKNAIIPLRESNINIRERLSSPMRYGKNDIIVWLMVFGIAIVNGWLTQSLSIFFLIVLLGVLCYVIPTKKWYHLGIDKLPVYCALLCTLFHLQ